MGSIKTLCSQMCENPVNVYGQNLPTFFYSVDLFLCWEIDAWVFFQAVQSLCNNLS